MVPEIPLKIGNCKNDMAASFKILLDTSKISQNERQLIVFLQLRNLKAHFLGKWWVNEMRKP